MKIDINLCTFRRPEVVETLRSIDRLQIPEGVQLRVIVIDNDHAPSARARVEAMADGMKLPVTYTHAPAGNIALARNAGLDLSEADWVAFLDDDETVGPDWLAAMIERQRETGADAVFGHSRAAYDETAPAWIVARDYHSNIVEARGGVVETGYTCNSLLRWGDAPWTDQRFDLSRGRSGGEDTEFFFRLRAMGASYAIADKATAHERVSPNRLTFQWLRQRKFRMGQSYSVSARGPAASARLFCTAAAKAAFCHGRALLSLPSAEARNYWLLRGALHLGVCTGVLSMPSRDLYGT
ncbi:glycosyltransferase family A protein (plasmid) [Salipiger sp. H15]|uniref:Glycosyltransferase family A protein n=1 Tax=Alloyangia sp. H15 TaxID=3029062 RepID=A0AAU8AQI7_9RHOB